MAAPLSGIGQQQQVPLSQPFQPGGNSDQTREVRQQNQQPRETEVQAQNAPAAQSQETDTQSDAFQSNLNDISFAANSNEGSSSENARRGDNLDIVV